MGPLRVLLLAALLALPAAAPTAEACSVPCGRIYPIILLSLAEGSPTMFPVKQGEPLTVEATLTYKFDALNDGYTATSPTDQPVVGFEFPRKPGWAEMAVEPERVTIPVDNPTYITPDPTASPPVATFSFSAKIKVTILVTGQPVLRDGYDYAKMLVFARSSESGLYQAAYGIKEIRIQPEGAIHESDLAGTRDVFTASPLPALDLESVDAAAAGVKATFTPPERPEFWESQRWMVALSPPPPGRVVLAMHDEWGNLVALDGPRDAAATLAFNATLVKPGHYTASATLLPGAGTLTPPVTLAAGFRAGDLSAEGYQYPKTYIVAQAGAVPPPSGNAADPTMQWERAVPFYAFDTAQAVSVLVTLVTPNDPGPLARGLANVQFSIVDPDGNALTSLSVDPTNPQRADRIGSVPMEGWYALRLRGFGLPAAAGYDARIEVDYAMAPQARNRADGVPDITRELSQHAGRNVTLPAGNASVWAATDLTPTFDKLANVQYQTTVVDADGALAYASGLRTGKSMFTAPAPGAHRAFVYAEPTQGEPFAPTLRSFAFHAGEAGRSVIAQKFPIEDAPLVPTSGTETLVALYALPYLDAAAKGAGSMPGGKLDTIDQDGKAGAPSTAGTYYLRAAAANLGPAAPMPVKYALDMPSPVTLAPEGGSSTPASTAFPVPGLAVGMVLAAAGVVAVAIAVLRRR